MPRWQRSWWPILANGGGDFFVVDGNEQGAVRRFRLDEADHPIEHRSLEALLVTAASAFDRRIFFVDLDGYLEMDDDQFADLAAELNPDVPWWAT